MNSTEKYGTDVDTAVQLALEELGVGIDDVEVEVLDEPTKGFLGTGLGRKLAFVRVSKKVPEEEPEEKPKKTTTIRTQKKSKQKPTQSSGQRTQQGSKKNSGDGNKNAGKAKAEKTEKVERAERAAEAEEKSLDELLESVEHVTPAVDIESLQDLGENEGLTFLKEMISAMNLEVSTVGKTDGKDVYMFIDGKDSGTIIGKRGATLDAIQYLTSLVVNKSGGDYTRVVVDAENYRAKREKTLEKLAMRMADKVVRSGRSFKLEPMNPYERKVIHATLQKDGRVVTRSEGQDPARRVVIDVK